MPINNDDLGRHITGNYGEDQLEHIPGGTHCGDTVDMFGRCVNMVDRDTQIGIKLGPELCKCECHENDPDYE